MLMIALLLQIMLCWIKKLQIPVGLLQGKLRSQEIKNEVMIQVKVMSVGYLKKIKASEVKSVRIFIIDYSY